MKVIKKAKQTYRFRMLRREFGPAGRIREIGAEFESDNIIESTDLVLRKAAEPCDIPPAGLYIAIRPFSLPGVHEAYKAEAMERVELLAGDALRLMVQGVVIPEDPNQWRPNDRRLRNTSASPRRKA